MSTISRRTALTGGTAAIAAVAVLPSLPALAGHPDAELFAAHSEFRELDAILETRLEMNGRIHKTVRARFPAIEAWANWRHDHADYWARHSCKICSDAQAACKPFEDEFEAALQAAGYDDTECDAEYADKMSAYDRAIAIPSRTIEGLWQKVEMIDHEFVFDDDKEVAIGRSDWDALVVGIGRLAGEAQS